MLCSLQHSIIQKLNAIFFLSQWICFFSAKSVIQGVVVWSRTTPSNNYYNKYVFYDDNVMHNHFFSVFIIKYM